MSVQQFRKRPLIVEAIRYLPGLTCADLAEFMGVGHDEHNCFDEAEWAVETPAGLVWAKPGDWIVRGARGEFYPIEPEIFRAIFDEIDSNGQQMAKKDALPK